MSVYIMPSGRIVLGQQAAWRMAEHHAYAMARSCVRSARLPYAWPDIAVGCLVEAAAWRDRARMIRKQRREGLS